MKLRDQDFLVITQKVMIDTREEILGLKVSHGQKSQEMSFRMRKSKRLPLGASLSTLVCRSIELGRRAEG